MNKINDKTQKKKTTMNHKGKNSKENYNKDVTRVGVVKELVWIVMR